MALITLLTDFGTRDGFVGAVKGVLATRASGVPIHDVAHDLPPGDVRKAGLVLERYWDLFPPGSVHLVVVDPGVGTGRRGLAARALGRFLVGPDNGVFGGVLAGSENWKCVSLDASHLLPPPDHPTFHGRDLFAPAAAFLATGTPLEALGAEVRDPRLLPEEPWRREGAWGVGRVLEVDRFGNLATNLPVEVVLQAKEIRVGSRILPLAGTFGDVDPGQPLALVDSDGRVALAVRDGSAARVLAMGPGDEVRVPWPGPGV
mgnify:CR=1 FL=1